MIRTTDQLIDRIAQDLTWRRRELTEMRALVQQSAGLMRHRVIVRSAIALLYAHWEGFVKKTSSYYLEFVASHRLPYRKLSANFVGLTLRAKFSELSATQKLSGANALAEFFCTSLDNQSNVPYRNVVDTQSNLSSKVLLDILAALGLDESQFLTRLHFIDANLVNPRNHIAHGEELFLSIEEYLEIHDDVVFLIETYRNLVENASVLRRFERQAASAGAAPLP